MGSLNGVARRRAALVAGAAVLTTVTAIGWPATNGQSPAAAAPVDQTVTFDYTGAEQSWVVPDGVTGLDVVAVGGSGADAHPVGGAAASGGAGAQVTAHLTVTPGSTLYVEVGGNGSQSAGGFNGGGFSTSPFVVAPGGGGGATDVRTTSCGGSCPGSETSLGSRLLVAGGGGGAGGGPGSAAAVAPKGGNGGAADHAGFGAGLSTGPVGGDKGTPTAPGAGGGTGPSGGDAGTDGALGQGGVGGAERGGGGAGGGGGGGYYGGGGGAGGGLTSDDTVLAVAGAGGGGGGSLVPDGGAIGFPVGTPPSVTFTYEVAPPATPTTWYAYPDGEASAPATCPRTTDPAQQCTLPQALAAARASDTVALADPGPYVGNFRADTPDTSATAPITIRPASGVTDPVLDGNAGAADGCTTARCDGSVLGFGRDVVATLSGVTVRNGNYATGLGGGLYLALGGALTVVDSRLLDNRAEVGGGIGLCQDDVCTLTVRDSTFSGNSADLAGGAVQGGYLYGPLDDEDHITIEGSHFDHNSAAYGGAVATADRNTNGALTISDSTFTDNSATSFGGAVEGGYHTGDATVQISGSTFSGNTSASYGGAVDVGTSGHGQLSVEGSTFTGNTARHGGAIHGGSSLGATSAITIHDSTFSSNSATELGGAIDSNDQGTGTLAVTGSTFSANSAGNDGGAIDNGDEAGSGALTVATSTFAGNTAGWGGAIDSGDTGGTGSADITASTFVGNAADQDGATISINGGSASMAASIVAGGCLRGDSWEDRGYNVGSDTSCFGIRVARRAPDESADESADTDVNAGSELAGSLSALRDHGGPTPTIQPLAGSPALAVVPDPTVVESVTLCPTVDQRGVASPPDAACAAGAVQPSPPSATVVSLSADPARATAGARVTFTAAVGSDRAACLAGTVTFSGGPTTSDPVATSADGHATWTVGDLPAGRSTITAAFTPGDDLDCVGSSDAMTYTVAEAAPPSTPPSSAPPSSAPTAAPPTSTPPTGTPGGPSDSLPDTGSPVRPWMTVLGCGLLGCGLAFLALARRGRGRRRAAR